MSTDPVSAKEEDKAGNKPRLGQRWKRDETDLWWETLKTNIVSKVDLGLVTSRLKSTSIVKANQVTAFQIKQFHRVVLHNDEI